LAEACVGGLIVSRSPALRAITDMRRLILSSVMSNCADNDAVTKSQEVSRTWSDAASLVQSIVKKIGASPQ
jgi:hypothetical protein